MRWRGNGARRLAARRATTTVEFAIIGTLLFSVTFAIIDVGAVMWVKGALQSVAEFAARCGAISSSSCSGTNGIQNYVVSQANTWIMSSATSSTYMTVTPSTVSSCQGVTLSGSYKQVTITNTYLTSNRLPPPFNNQTISVSACYPCVNCCTSC